VRGRARAKRVVLSQQALGSHAAAVLMPLTHNKRAKVAGHVAMLSSTDVKLSPS
jgi:hypothetical protein